LGAAKVRAIPSVFIRENPRPKCFSLRPPLDTFLLPSHGKLFAAVSQPADEQY
jgi:hypothetical protein